MCDLHTNAIIRCIKYWNNKYTEQLCTRGQADLMSLPWKYSTPAVSEYDCGLSGSHQGQSQLDECLNLGEDVECQIYRRKVRQTTVGGRVETKNCVRTATPRSILQ